MKKFPRQAAMLSLLCVFSLAHLRVGACDHGPAAAVRARSGSHEPSLDTPPPLTHYKGRQIAKTMHYLGAPWLVRESREREEDCENLLRELDVKPGQKVCDMGCGNGFYTLQLAKLVGPEGKVYAVDIQPEMLRLLRDRAEKDGLRNIVPVLGTATEPGLPVETLDLVLLVDVYHEFSHPEQMLGAIRKSLSADGLVALAEFRAEDPSVPIKPLHKMSKKQIMKEFPSNGFKLAEEYDELPWQHLMFFAKDLSVGVSSGDSNLSPRPGKL
jgi:ubiquinone/menaquinone biosynthesis C-methylase UbiE